MVRWCLSLRLSLNCTVLMAPRVSLDGAVRIRQPTNKRAGGQPGGTRAFAPTKEDGVTAGEHTGEHWLVGYQTATRGSMLVRRRERSASSQWESLQGRSKFAGGSVLLLPGRCVSAAGCPGAGTRGALRRPLYSCTNNCTQLDFTAELFGPPSHKARRAGGHLGGM